MIDFTNCKINKFKYYGGKNGGKICIIYNDEEFFWNMFIADSLVGNFDRHNGNWGFLVKE